MLTWCRILSFYVFANWVVSEDVEIDSIWENWSFQDDLEIYILNWDWTASHYTIKDRNMWATEVWTGSSSYGYHYQRWNNYWFPLNNSNITYRTNWNGHPNWDWVPSSYYETTWYAWETNPSFQDEREGNMRWGFWDTEEANGTGTTRAWRRWPCPEWYYIPSIKDLSTMYNTWLSVKTWSSNIGDLFVDDFIFPPAWNSLYQLWWTNSRQIYYTWNNSYFWDYWTSSPSSIVDGYSIQFTNNRIIPNVSQTRNYWKSVRCFKNKINDTSLTIHALSWFKDVITIHWNEINTISEWWESWIQTWYTFLWWYSSPNFEEESKVRSKDLFTWTDLYAKVECSFWYALDSNGACVPWFTVNYDSRWWSSVKRVSQLPWTNVNKPEDPTRSNSRFLWWYISGTDTLQEFPIHLDWDVYLYAKWECLNDTLDYWIACRNGRLVSFDTKWWTEKESLEVGNGRWLREEESVSMSYSNSCISAYRTTSRKIITITWALSLETTINYTKGWYSYGRVVIRAWNQPSYSIFDNTDCSNSISWILPSSWIYSYTTDWDTITIWDGTSDDHLQCYWSYSVVVTWVLDSTWIGEKPTKEWWYVFKWWYKDEELEEIWDFENDTVTGDITLYAKWGCEDWYMDNWNMCVESVIVSFNTRWWTEKQPITVGKWMKLISIWEDPERDDSSFLWWYKDEELEEIWDFENDTVTGDITLYAKWGCEDWYMDNWNMCVESVIVSFNTRWWTEKESIKIEKWGYLKKTATKYSHTRNVTDAGEKTTNYGNGWTNADIRGTDRISSSSDAHVLTFPGANNLIVDLYYNGESISYDWVSVWKWSYSSYSASSNYSSVGAVTTSERGLSTNKYWDYQYGTYTVNGNNLTNMWYTRLNIPWDSVTFSFRSDSSGYGNGYGYYAIVQWDIYGVWDNPEKINAIFRWWYKDSTYQEEIDFNEPINNNITLYAKWEECGEWKKVSYDWDTCINDKIIEIADGETSTVIQSFEQEYKDLDLYFLSWDWTQSHLTLMDRNIWAISNDITTTDSYWYIYQWWNNYWFTPTSMSTLSESYNSTQVEKSIWSKYVPSKYARNIWSTSFYNRMAWANYWDWIWWWTWDTTSANGASTTKEWRQWPCPEWYYIPSTKDWSNIKTIRWSTTLTGGNWKQFSSDFLMPFAWYRNRDTSVYTVGTYGYYWSSSPEESYSVNNVWFLKIIASNITLENSSYRSYGHSVRCFKNTPNGKTLTLHANWGTWVVVGVLSWWVAEWKVMVNTLGKPSFWENTFMWWYTSSWFQVDTKVSTWDIIDADAHLYAKWDCGDWYIRNLEGACVASYTITYDATINWGIVETSSEEIEQWATITLWNIYNPAIKTWWIFVWWNTSSTAHEWLASYTVNSDTTLYAIFKKEGETLTGTIITNGAIISPNEITCDTETIWNNNSEIPSCTLNFPLATRTDGEVLWYSTTNGELISPEISNGWTYAISENTTFYVISRTPLTATFYKNGNISQTKNGWAVSTEEFVTDSCYLWNTSSSCSIITPVFIPATGKTAKGYTRLPDISSVNNPAYIEQNTEINLTDNIVFYAQSKKDKIAYSVEFRWNGSLLSGDDGLKTEITVWCETEDSYNSEDETKTTECTISVPEIIRSEEDTFILWYGTWSDDTITVLGKTIRNLTLTEENSWTIYYAISYKTLYTTFKWNWNKQIQNWTTEEKVTDIIEGCRLWNTATTCSIITPDIVGSKNWDVWYASRNEKINKELNRKSENTEIDVTEESPKTYFAWSVSDPEIYTVSYSIGTWILSMWEIATESEWCKPELTYNNEELITTCRIGLLPTLTEKVGYHTPKWYIEWDEEAYTPGAVYWEEISWNINFIGRAIANTDTVYHVKHYFQMLEWEGVWNRYKLEHTDVRSGTTDSTLILSELQVSPEKQKWFRYRLAKINWNFTSNIVSDETLEELVSQNLDAYEWWKVLEIQLFYDRLAYNYEMIGGEWVVATGWSTENGTYYYEQEIILSWGVENDCYIWSWWNMSGTWEIEMVEVERSYETGDVRRIKMPARSLVVTPELKEKVYSISFNKNGENVEGEMDVIPLVRCTETITLPENWYTREWYSFEWWSKTSWGEVIYEDKETITSPLTKENNANVVLYAQWNLIPYEINYELNGWEVKGNPEIYTIESEKIELENPEKTGHTFLWWSGTNIQWLSWKVVIPSWSTGYKEYEANWVINQYTITFDTKWWTEIPSIKADYGTEIVAPQDPEKTGYIFMWWDKTIPETMPAEDITITAQWSPIQYTVTMYANDGSEEKWIEHFVYDKEMALQKSYQRDGYEFSGWNTEREWNWEWKRSPVYNWTTVSGDNIDLYAQWNIIPYEITYILDGWVVEGNPETYNVESEFVLNSPDKIGHTFLWWTWGVLDENLRNESNWTEKPVMDIQITRWSTGDREYTAQYQINQYELTLHTNGWTAIDPIVEDVYYDEEIIEPKVEKEWYTTKWWEPTLPKRMMAKAFTSRVVMQAHEYKVMFHANNLSEEEIELGIEEETREQNFVYDEGQTLAKNEFERLGYTFKWWNEDSEATEVEYEDEEEVLNLTSEDWGIIDLYAVWEPRTDTKFNVKLYLEKVEWGYPEIENFTGESRWTTDTMTNYVAPPLEGFEVETINNTKIKADESAIVTVYYTRKSYEVRYQTNSWELLEWDSIRQIRFESMIPLPEAIRTWYQFRWWTWVPEEGIMPSTPVILNAQWEAESYTVSFDTQVEGLQVNPSEKEVIYDGIYWILPVVEREGYIFDGWYTEQEWWEKVESGTIVTIAGNHTLYAYWQEITERIYKVNHLLENANDSWYVLAHYDEKEGLIGEQTQAEARFYTWFKAEDFEQEIIKRIWETVVEIKYARNKYAITFDSNWWTAVEVLTWKYEQTLTQVDSPIKTGYVFSWWTPKFPDTMPLWWMNLVAEWKASTGTHYTVEYYLKNLEGEYVLDHTENGVWETEQQTAAQERVYAWFTLNRIEDTTILADGSAVAKVYYDRDNYIVMFNTQAEWVEVVPSAKEVIYGWSYWELPVAERQGYTFNGWYTWIEGWDKIESGTTVTITNNQTLYAQWTANSYTVSFNTQVEELNAVPSQKEVVYDNIYWELPEVARQWYVFRGWYTQTEGWTRVESGTTVKITNNHTLSAQWRAWDSSYHVEHYLKSLEGVYVLDYTENWVGETEQQTAAQERPYAWFTLNRIENTTILADGSAVAKVYYDRNSYTVSFNTQVGGLNAVPSQKEVTYGWSYWELPVVERAWYTFNGWYTWTEGWDKIKSGTTVTITNNQTLYAQWTANSYTVSFNTQVEGLNAVPSQKEVTYGWSYWELPVVGRQGYVFSGWYTQTEGWTRVESGIIVSITNNQTLYAQWRPWNSLYHVNHYLKNLDGVTYTLKDTETLEGKTESQTVAQEKTYEWFSLENEVTQESILADQSTQINIYYKRNNYRIEVIAWTGVEEVRWWGVFTYWSTIEVGAKTKEGYTFSWWVREKNFEVEVPSEDSNVIIHATANKYLVKYITLEWEGEMEDQEFTYDITWTLRDNQFVNSWYLLKWWETENGDEYSPWAEIINLATWWTVTLIAQWQVPHKVKYMDAWVILFEEEYASGDIIKTSRTPSKSGYRFDWWEGMPTNNIMWDEDLEVVAKWTNNQSVQFGGGWAWGGVIISKDTSSASKTETTSKDSDVSVKKDKDTSTITKDDHTSAKDTWETVKNVESHPTVTKEVLDAYQWAYKNEVTTLSPVEGAMPDGYVYRWHMAKMVVNYALNVLGWELPKETPEECTRGDKKIEWESNEIKNYARMSCELGIMWIDMQNFEPRRYVTRAQFGTVLSRLLWWDTYNQKWSLTNSYYERHLNELKEKWIITQIDNPEQRIEQREWVWVMLMRSDEYIKSSNTNLLGNNEAKNVDWKAENKEEKWIMNNVFDSLFKKFSSDSSK